MVDILERLDLLAAIFDDLLRAQQETDVGGVRVTDGDDLTAPAIGVLFPCGAIKRRISVRDRDRTDPLDHGIEVNPAAAVVDHHESALVAHGVRDPLRERTLELLPCLLAEDAAR